MDGLLAEHAITCPACWETIELLVDLSAGDQVYSEDCSVCCRPMTVTVTVNGDHAEVSVDAES